MVAAEAPTAYMHSTHVRTFEYLVWVWLCWSRVHLTGFFFVPWVLQIFLYLSSLGLSAGCGMNITKYFSRIRPSVERVSEDSERDKTIL